MFIRRESFRQFIRLYPVVSWLIGIHTVLFVLMYLMPPLFHHQSIIYLLGVGNHAAIEAGQYWRIISAMFLHGGIGHFIFNNFALVLFAPALERMLGKLVFIGTYLFAGIVGNIATHFIENNPFINHLGASGAVYGLLGVYIYMIVNKAHLIDPQSRQIVVIILIIGAVYSFFPGINWIAHLFGFIGGAVAAPLALRRA